MASKKSKSKIDLSFLRGDGAEPRTDLSDMFASSVASESEMQQARMVSIDRLLNNPYQPRLAIREEQIEELAAVIKAQGFQGVLVARPDPVNAGFYQLTAGHRRREASRRAGLATLPVVVRELTDEEMITLAITENIQREDLTPLEEGKIYLLMADEMGYTHEQIATEIGRKRGYVENRIRIARAPRDVQALVQAMPDNSIRKVASLIKVRDPEERAEIIQHLLSGTLTVEDLPGYISAKVGAQNAIAAANKLFAQMDSRQQREAAHEEHRGPQALTANGHAHDSKPALGAKHEPAVTHTHPSPVDPEERNRIRIGSAKLAAALRYMTTYNEQAAGRLAISEGEREMLERLHTLVIDLHARFAEREQVAAAKR